MLVRWLVLAVMFVGGVRAQHEQQVRSRIEALRRGGTVADDGQFRVSPSIVPSLITALRDSNPNVRIFSATTLGRVGSEARSAVPALAIAVTDDDNVDVRTTAATALGNIGPVAESALSALMKAFNDRGSRREFLSSPYYAVSLAKIGPPDEVGKTAAGFENIHRDFNLAESARGIETARMGW